MRSASLHTFVILGFSLVVTSGCGAPTSADSFKSSGTIDMGNQTTGTGGGTITPPTAQPTATPRPPVPTPPPAAASPTPTPRPTATPTPTPRPTATPAPTPTPTPAPTAQPNAYAPTVAPAVIPPGATFSSYTANLETRSTARVVYGEPRIGADAVTKHKWTQTAGPIALFFANKDSYALTVYGLTVPGIYDLRYDGESASGQAGYATRRLVVSSNGVVTTAYVPPAYQGPPTSTVPGTFKALRVLLFQQGRQVTTGSVIKGMAVTPRVYLVEHDGKGGEIVSELDRNTLFWTAERPFTDSSCPMDQVQTTTVDAFKTYSLTYTQMPGNVTFTIGTFHRGSTATAGFNGGDYSVDGVGKSTCRVYAQANARIEATSKTVDGRVIGTIHRSKQVEYGFVIDR